MEYPNGSQRLSHYQSCIRAAHKARSEVLYSFAVAAKNGVLALARLVASPLMRLFRRLDRTRRLRAAQRELEAMDDHMLADLGISRQDIDDVVRNGKSAPDNLGNTQPVHPHEARRAAEVAALGQKPDLMGAIIVHGPWGHYSDRRRKRSNAA